MANPATEGAKKWRWFKSFQYDAEKDSPGDARNVLLVVAALITAVTFQARVNPPGGVWQDTKDGHFAGRAIYATNPHAYYVFLVANTLALSSAVLVIVSLTYRFPFHFELWVSTAAMLITYSSAVFAVTPDDCVRFRYILLTGAAPFLGRFLWEVYHRWGRRHS